MNLTKHCPQRQIYFIYFGSSTSLNLVIVNPGSYFQFPLAFVERRLFFCIRMDNITSVALLVIVVACVGAIMGHATPGQVVDEIFTSERPYLSCVLYFACTLVNCGLNLVLLICTVPRIAARWLHRHRRWRRWRRKAVRRILTYQCHVVSAEVFMVPHASATERALRSQRRCWSQKCSRGRTHEAARKPASITTAALPQKRFETSSESNFVSWLAGFVVLAANPCTAALFPSEYLAMPFVMLAAPCVATVLCFFFVYWLLLSWCVASMGVALYKRAQSYRIRRSARDFEKDPCSL